MKSLQLILIMITVPEKFAEFYTQGNLEVMQIFNDWLKPFNDLGASTVTSRNTSGTDHQSFDAVGLPGFSIYPGSLGIYDQNSSFKYGCV